MFDEEPLPQAVVLDTSFVVNVLHENEDYHAPCLRFAERLLGADVIVVYSALLRLEFWHGWARAVRLRGVPQEMLQQPRLVPDPGLDRSRAYSTGDRFLKDFLRLFRRYEVRIGVRLLDRALSLMERYNLTSHDACVLAIAFYTDVLDVGSLDRKFRRVDGIQLWNNHLA
jgi:predicted nucleic acid-binding protein